MRCSLHIALEKINPNARAFACLYSNIIQLREHTNDHGISSPIYYKVLVFYKPSKALPFRSLFIRFEAISFTMPAIDITDSAAVERASQAVRQLERQKKDLGKERVELISRIKLNEARLEEVTLLRSILRKEESVEQAELDSTRTHYDGLKELRSTFSQQERSLLHDTRMASISASHKFGKNITKFAVMEKAAARGYSSSQGTTCSRAEVRDRERRARAVRSMMISTTKTKTTTAGATTRVPGTRVFGSSASSAPSTVSTL